MRAALEDIPMDAIQTLVRIIGDRTVNDDKKEALLAASEVVSFASFILPPIGQPLNGPVMTEAGCDEDDCNCDLGGEQGAILYHELATAIASHDAEAGVRAMQAVAGGASLNVMDWYRILKQAIDMLLKLLA